jgi:hypothetical protein
VRICDSGLGMLIGLNQLSAAFDAVVYFPQMFAL